MYQIGPFVVPVLLPGVKFLAEKRQDILYKIFTRHDSIKPVQNRKKESSHFDLKRWVTGGTKIRLRIKSNWRIFESNVLKIDSNFLQLLGIPGRILVPPVTQLFRLKWRHFFFLLGNLFELWKRRLAHPTQS